MMWQDVVPSLVTAIIGALSTVWAYWAGRKKRHIEHVKDTSAAIRELNDTIIMQADRNGDLKPAGGDSVTQASAYGYDSEA